MPQVPIYQPQTTAPAIPNVQMRSAPNVGAVQDINNRTAAIVSNNIKSGLDDFQSGIDKAEKRQDYLNRLEAKQQLEIDKQAAQARKDQAQAAYNNVLMARQNLTSGDNGFMRVTGGDVLPDNRQSKKSLVTDYVGQFDEAFKAATEGLDQDQKDYLLNHHYAKDRISFTGQLQRHEIDQTQNYRVGIHTNTAAIAKQNAANVWNDPGQLTAYLGKTHEALSDVERITGKPQQGARQSATDNIYGDAIRSALDNKAADYGVSLYGQVKHLLSADEQHKIESLFEATARQQDVAGKKAVDEAWSFTNQALAHTPEKLAEWNGVASGTKYASDLAAAIDTNHKFQQLMQLPIEQQRQSMAEYETAIRTNGGTPEDLKRYNAMNAAITENLKTLTTNPMQYQRTRTQDAPPPIDLNNPQKLAAALDKRETQLRNLKAQFGDPVPEKFLEPHEVKQIKDSLNGGTPQEQIKLLANLYSASPKHYNAVIGQVAKKDNGVIARAGQLAALNGDVNFGGGQDRGWFSGYKADKRAKRDDVGETILNGNAILRDQKGSVYNQNKSVMRMAFMAHAGGIYAGSDPSIADRDFNTFYAYFVGDMARRGDMDLSQIEQYKSSGADGLEPLFKSNEHLRNAFAATVGHVTKSVGTRPVPMPQHLDDETIFKGKVAAQLDPIVKAMHENGIDDYDDGEDMLDDYAIVRVDDNKYRLVSGVNSPVYFGGKPVEINLEP